jgi:hypothetical protein
MLRAFRKFTPQIRRLNYNIHVQSRYFSSYVPRMRPLIRSFSLKRNILQKLPIWNYKTPILMATISSSTVTLTTTITQIDSIQFDRDSIVIPFSEWHYTPGRSELKDTKKREGYWASSKDKNMDFYGGRYPFPKAHEEPWSGKKEFLKKLAQIEEFAFKQYENKELRNEYQQMVKKKKEDLNTTFLTIAQERECWHQLCVKYYGKHRIIMNFYKGLSISRIDGTYVGSSEYEDTEAGIIWPQGYSTHYIGKYNVIPSREFYLYVMNFSID